jgi:predicted nucleotidyltransferase component of viral defense system
MKNRTWSAIIFSILVLGLLACSKVNSNESTRSIAEEYYEIYKARKDFKKFLGFYDEQIVLEDIINGDQKAFLNWDNTEFKLIDTAALVLEDLVVDGNKAFAKGYFTTFQWGDSQFEAMHFTTILYFNEDQKIVRQVDWINYPNSVFDFEKRKNANDWIPKK